MKKKKLIREQLEVKLQIAHPLVDISAPPKGWIRAIRDALGMSARQLAERLGVAQQRVALMEKDEITDSLTLKTMRRVAECLGCVFVYGFVPRTSLEETVRDQAKRSAAKHLARASHTMDLENQGLTKKENERALSDMTDELVESLPSTLWDEQRTVIDLEYPPGATPLNRDEAQGLLLTHITTRGELDRWEQDNIVEALAWLKKTKPMAILNESFVRKLHQRMFANVWNWAGQFRQSDKNIGGPWWRISTDLKALCDDIHWRIKQQLDSSDDIAVCFHHRLVSIHPFPNGNGRHARLMADILLENVMNSERFSWGGQDLSETSNVRQQYITGLRAADKGDYKPLLEFARS